MFNGLRVILIASSVFGACATVSRAEVVTVPSVDLKRYVGDWYEIGSIPQWFQRGCQCTIANYQARADGKIAVKNSCRRNAVDSPIDVAHGTGTVIDPGSNARLLVSFFWPLSGSYDIIGLDPDYRWSVVTNDGGTSLWILSRTPKLEEPLLSAAWSAATAQVDVSKFEWTVQAGCPR